MDDLNGLDWSSSQSNSQNQTANPSKPVYTYPTLQPTPSPAGSGRSTPLAFGNAQNASKVLRPGSKPPTPANDSFANLLKPGANKTVNTLSLQERQRQIQDEKLRQEQERRKKLDAQYGGGQGGAFWDGLGQQRQQRTISPPTPATGLSSTINKPFAGVPKRATPQDDDDMLAAFNSSATVDASSHYPPPAQRMGSNTSTPANLETRRSPPPPQNFGNGGLDFDHDDDPFGLSEIKQKPSASMPASSTHDDDDILGMLGRPVSEVPKPAPSSTKQPRRRRSPTPPSPVRNEDHAHPQAKAVSELVDMGFPADKAADALAQTDTGMNVQAAVSILLIQAHEAAKQKSQGRQESQNRHETERSRRLQRESRPDASAPPWARDEGERERSGSRPNGGAQADLAKQAQDIGTSLFKSANSLWKVGQKKVQRAVADLQQEGGGDPSQPKWMRDAQLQEAASQRRPTSESRPRNNGKAPEPAITNEAMLLEGGGRPPKPPRSAEISRSSTPASTGSWNDIPDDMFSAPRSRGTSRQPPSRPAAERLTRQEVEKSAAEVVVSSRRRRPAPATANSGISTPSSSTPPIASPPVQTQSRNPFNSPKPVTSAPPSKPATPIPARPKAPPRNIPSVSSIALQNSSQQRAHGTEAFKRGDYGTAHTHYTSALQGIPTSHPIAIIILCNRSLTSIKNGDPRAAISDADTALGTIGISRGEGEKITLGAGEADKDMKEFYGKALMRKAEALENMEKWADAAKVWREAVEAGAGGAVSMQGKQRCEKAAGGGSARSTPAPRPAAARKPPARPKPASALAALQGSEGTSSEAVQRMRAANAAAEKADDEKFALTDSVDARLVAWKGTKSDNLRALLGSLEKVLWEGAGWNKVGMQDLVMPNKVKIVYMKAIAKVHPDKIPQDATTEQRMISAAVFATLNEAWDKFKTDNGL